MEIVFFQVCVTLDMWHITSYTWHLTYDMWHMTLDGGEYSLKICERQCFEDGEEKDDLIS